jgi:DNA-binding response OmpR family regulator
MDADLKSRTVLIVEDEPLIALDIAFALEAAGAVTLTAHSLREARQLVECKDVSAAVLDFGLGDGDAEWLCHHLSDRNIPFVLHTGYSDPRTACSTAISIPKPSPPSAIVRAVTGLLQ